VAADPLQRLAGSLTQVRHAIARIAEQREASERRFGVLVVDEARLLDALRAQRSHLDSTRDEIERARDLAAKAADAARAEGTDATPYEQTVAGLARQADVVAASRTQLADAEQACEGNVSQARALLQDNQARLDASLREQLHLLAALERLDGDRGVDQARKGWQRGHQ
jgi:chromosome segregation ATPase